MAGFSGSNGGFIEPLERKEVKKFGEEKCQLELVEATQEL